MRKLLWLLTILGSVFGAVIVLGGVSAAKSAVQECSAVSIGLAFAVIPYCLARAWTEIGK